jgi:polyisoprenoid-binding protein YceI
MTKWTFEPGHTAAEFCARHMMVTYVRGHFKNIHGTLVFDATIVLSVCWIWMGHWLRSNLHHDQ